MTDHLLVRSAAARGGQPERGAPGQRERIALLLWAPGRPAPLSAATALSPSVPPIWNRTRGTRSGSGPRGSLGGGSCSRARRGLSAWSRRGRQVLIVSQNRRGMVGFRERVASPVIWSCLNAAAVHDVRGGRPAAHNSVSLATPGDFVGCADGGRPRGGGSAICTLGRYFRDGPWCALNVIVGWRAGWPLAPGLSGSCYPCTRLR